MPGAVSIDVGAGSVAGPDGAVPAAAGHGAGGGAGEGVSSATMAKRHMLNIASTLTLPVDAATQTFAFIARKGAGKTYTAGKLVELLLTAHVQVVVLDTVGNWYGLRLGADGRSAGFDVPVIGGLRGDIPLEATGGALIADIVVDTGRSVVLDASQFSLADRKRFATAFGERLWLRKKGERHPAPLHLVIEESQLIVPQFTGTGGGDIARMLGIYEEIIRLGRNYGIGVSMITRRPQSVNKEVLNQTECLFVGQVNGAQERDALKKWITHQGMDVHLVDELPGLKVGTFYVWSPQWLDVLERVQILKKRTLDASATPKVGDTRVRRELKPLDLEDLQARLAATIERQKADDPRELRKTIARLQADLKRKDAQVVGAAAAVDAATNRKVIEKPVITDAQVARMEKLVDRFGKGLDAAMRQHSAICEPLQQLISGVHAIVRRQRQMPMTTPRPTRNDSNGNAKPIATQVPPADGLTPAKQKILNGLPGILSDRRVSGFCLFRARMSMLGRVYATTDV